MGVYRRRRTQWSAAALLNEARRLYGSTTF
jgi:hypothetical protein